ncbi:MAG: hypothetical protein ACK5HY_07025, partial [Parahaliea sp.]
MRLPSVPRTATSRIAGLYLLLFVLSGALLASLLLFGVRGTMEEDARAQIITETNLLLFEYREDGLDELLEETEERIEKSRTRQRLLYRVQNPAGRVVFDRVPAAQPPYGWRRSDGEEPALFLFTVLDNGYVLGVGKDLAALDSVEQALGRALLWVAGAVLMLGAAGGYILSRRTLAQLEAINRALGDWMSADPDVVLLGEDIRSPYGGAFKVTRGLSFAHPDRVLNTPISEAAIVGIGNGLALGGKRPVVEIMFGDFLTLCFDQILNHAAKFRGMYNRQVENPLVVRTPMGGGRGYGPTHSQNLEKHFAGVPGLRVL